MNTTKVTARNLYNEDFKNNFLDMFPEGNGRAYYRRIFEKTASKEEELNKDLYEFSLEEIEEIMYSLNPLTLNAAQTNFSVISSYINYSIEKDVRSNKLNQLRTLVGAQWCNNFVDKTKKLYFSFNEIMDIEKECPNYQDSVIVDLLFNGVYGRDFSEIRNLKREDVNGNMLTLKDDSAGYRTLKVNDHTLNQIKMAYLQSTYAKMNKTGKSTDKYTNLVENDFIIRKSKTSKLGSDEAPVERNVIFRRIKWINQIMNLPYLTTKNIFRSGVIYEAMKMYVQDGCLNKDHYEILAYMFNVAHPFTLKEYVNIETIESLYPEVKE